MIRTLNRQRKLIFTVTLLIPLVIVLSGIPAHADACAPLVMLIWPESWLYLILIIPIEIAIGLRILSANRTTIVKAVVKANIVSTLVGIPLTSIICYIFGTALLNVSGAYMPVSMDWTKLTLFQKFWMMATLNGLMHLPFNSESSLHLWVPAVVLCIPYFFLSVWLEYLVGRAFFSKEKWGSVRRWAWIANACSYTFILIVLGIRLLWMSISG